MLGTTLGAADIFKPGSNKLVGQVLSGTPFEAARDYDLRVLVLGGVIHWVFNKELGLEPKYAYLMVKFRVRHSELKIFSQEQYQNVEQG